MHQTLPDGLPAAGYKVQSYFRFSRHLVLSWDMIGKSLNVSFLESCILHKIENMENSPHGAAGGTQ